jgi:L-arabinose isomerase
VAANGLVRRQNLPARVGLFSIGLAAYWPQFPGMKERLEKLAGELAGQLEAYGAEVHSAGMVDTPEAGKRAGDFFCEQNVDIIFLHVATYCTSHCVLPAVQRRKVPVVVLGLQPEATFDYGTLDTQEWLAGDVFCTIPEISCVFERAGIPFHLVIGQLYDDARSQAEVKSWVTAASISRTIYYARLGFLGHTYPGMLDLNSDPTMHAAQLGAHVEVVEMCELKQRVDQVTDEMAAEIVAQTREMFDVTDNSAVDKLASPPTEEQLLWGGRVAKGLELLFSDFDLTTLAYYYHGQDNNEYERISAGLILGNTFLTSNGYACATEGDLKTTVAMLILDSLGAGGSFCEIALLDFKAEFMLMGHDGPGHIEITAHKPILRGLELYHGKAGSGVSVEFNVKNGPITVLSMTQTGAGKLKLVVSEGESVPGEIMKLGNCNTRVVFSKKPAEWLSDWCHAGPTHHCALGLGHHIPTIRRLADILDIELTVVG